MQSMKIVVLDGSTLNPGDLDWKVLEAFGQFEVYQESDKTQVVSRAANAEILLVNKVVIDSSVLNELPKLRMIAVTATGYNNIDIEACKRANITVSNVVNYGSTTVAQHVFALLLELTNRASRHHLLVQKGEWRKRRAFSFWVEPIVELADKTMGIIGMGHIGQEVARIANGFRMNVQYYSASDQSCPNATSVDLSKLIANSDVITLHTHLHGGNAEMVNAEFLDAMKPRAFLINTARGGLVDEAALYDALRHHRIGGAGLDVLNEEPPHDHHELLLLDNCIVTPHNAWASKEARQRLLDLTCENIRSFLDGQPIHVVS